MDELIERIRLRIAEGQPCDSPDEWLPVQPPIDMDLIAEAEAELGFVLPALLRRLYTEIGNGGFGPVFGLLPLSRESLKDDCEFDLVGQYNRLRNRSPGRAGWRPGMVPVFYCGCTVFEFVDCTTEGGPVVPLDLGAEMDALPPIESLTARLEEWLADRQPW